MAKIQFRDIGNDDWWYTLPDGTDAKVDAAIIERYIIPAAHGVYSSQYYITTDVDVPGFGTHTLHLELFHVDGKELDGAYITIGGRDDDAYSDTRQFALDIPEDN